MRRVRAQCGQVCRRCVVWCCSRSGIRWMADIAVNLDTTCMYFVGVGQVIAVTVL